MAALSAKQVAEYLYEYLQPLLKLSDSEGMFHGELMDILCSNHPEITDEMRKTTLRTHITTRRANCNAAGWLFLDQNSRWQVTNEGRLAFKEHGDPLDFMNTATRLRNAIKRNDKSGSSELKPEQTVEDEDDTVNSTATKLVEDTTYEANKSISNYLHSMEEYAFQNLVADLLKAMGYHIDWVSPPGPDGGLDIVAFVDHLGVQPPIIKVQVKRWKGKIAVSDVKSFRANLGAKDVGIFVALGGFTSEAEKFCRECDAQITLVNLDGFVTLWKKHYDKLSDEAKRKFTLKPIYFFIPNDEA